MLKKPLGFVLHFCSSLYYALADFPDNSNYVFCIVFVTIANKLSTLFLLKIKISNIKQTLLNLGCYRTNSCCYGCLMCPVDVADQTILLETAT